MAPPYLGLECLIIREPFYVAFISATCVDNVRQSTEPTTHRCFMVDTAGNGTGYGKYVNYYTSAQGFSLSAALRKDYWGWGFPNAPGTTNGDPTYNYPNYNGLPTTPTARMPEEAIDRMMPIRPGYTLHLRRWSSQLRMVFAWLQVNPLTHLLQRCLVVFLRLIG